MVGACGCAAAHDLQDGVARMRRRTHRLGSWALVSVGVALVLAVVVWQGFAALWMAHSSQVGHALVRQIRDRPSSAACVAPPSPQVRGLLEIPAIGLVAPVGQGTSTAELGVAVGHDAQSVWPGRSGTAVLEAHDVSYFSQIDRLRPGDRLRYVTPCATYDFTVARHAIVRQGTVVPNTAGPTLVLVTCWPLNALWFTPDRYLVDATLSHVVSTAFQRQIARRRVSAPGPAVPAPRALAAQGLTLTAYEIPMGRLTLTGSPSAQWAASPGPLAVESSGLEAFIGALRALEEGQPAWWRALAPAVGLPTALAGAPRPTFVGPLNVAIAAVGDAARSVQLSTVVALPTGTANRSYRLVVAETIHHGQLVISGWTLQAEVPASAP